MTSKLQLQLLQQQRVPSALVSMSRTTVSSETFQFINMLIQRQAVEESRETRQAEAAHSIRMKDMQIVGQDNANWPAT